ncbi:MAG: lytic transglycosylase [Pseudomonadota bacterium]
MSSMIRFLSFAALVLLGSCGVSGPPMNLSDACSIYDERPSWRRAVERTESAWGAPASIQLAIMWQESRFVADARPPRRRGFLGLFPGARRSSAYGYAQAIDGTWDWYRSDTGRRGADRDRFSDASDFIGWYMAKTTETNGVWMLDAYNQYLAYHEGHTGYRRGSYSSKSWLTDAARRVADQAAVYDLQLSTCT